MNSLLACEMQSLLHFPSLLRIRVAGRAARIAMLVLPDHLADELDLVLELAVYNHLGDVVELGFRPLLLEECFDFLLLLLAHLDAHFFEPGLHLLSVLVFAGDFGLVPGVLF